MRKFCGNCDRPNCMFRDGAGDGEECVAWSPIPKTYTLEEYRQDVFRTARKDLPQIDQLTVAAMGAAGEAGELLELIKKHRYHNHDLDRKKAVEEAGDALYYLVLFLETLGSSIDEAIRHNIIKRQERYPQGFDPVRSRGRA